LLADETALDVGIQRMAERSELEITTLRQRLETVANLIGENEDTINRLAVAFAEAENDSVAGALKLELNNAGKKMDALQDERARLLAEIQQGILRPEEIAMLKEMAAMREELEEASFETKRALLDKINFLAELYHAEDGRRLKVSCSLSAAPISLPIDISHTCYAPTPVVPISHAL
jgi:hypothetical protein